ncbi:uncharacterized protein SCHCODRAFT_01190579, partial [Schizophyllum commune H4-8]
MNTKKIPFCLGRSAPIEPSNAIARQAGNCGVPRKRLLAGGYLRAKDCVRSTEYTTPFFMLPACRKVERALPACTPNRQPGPTSFFTPPKHPPWLRLIYDRPKSDYRADSGTTSTPTNAYR